MASNDYLGGASRPGFADAMAKLIATPGACSGDAMFVGGRRAGKTAAAPVIRGNEFTDVWIDEDFGDFDMAGKAETVSEQAINLLNELAGRMTEHFGDTKESVTLLSPGNLTVTVPGKGYQKQNHIGGEGFTPVRAYVGSQKTGSRLIFVFKPESASSYGEMEMNENEALTNLNGFRASANSAAGGDFLGELKEIRKIDSAAREAESVKEKFNEYADFGAW